MLRLIAMVYLAAGFWLLAPASGGAAEPIVPLPQTVEYDRAKALLGKRLFFDTRLSSDGKVSCATCHDPDSGGAESRPVSIGVYRRADTINAPTVFNAIFNFRQFWNGRARNLKEQAIGPIHLFKSFGCAFCHNGINIGGNSLTPCPSTSIRSSGQSGASTS